MATSAEPKRYLLVGFDAAFERHRVEFVHSLPATVPVCSSCSALPSEHYTLSCEHAFCAACFEDVVRTRPSSLQCPVDNKNTRIRNAVPKQTTSVEAVDRLLVFCWYRQRGCTYTGHLTDMTSHFQGCAFYTVVCPLCYKEMYRSNLAAHFAAVHEERVRSARHDPSMSNPGCSRVPTVNVNKFDGASILWPTSTDTWRIDMEGDIQQRVKDLVEPLVEAATFRAAEDIAQHNQALCLELFSGVELIKDRLVELADATRVALPTGASVVGAAAPPSRPRILDIPVRRYTWVVKPYSRLQVGVHFVDSPVFFVSPGYKVELRACILAVDMMEISVSVKVHRTCARDAPAACQPPWPLPRTCRFTLFHNESFRGNVTSSFSLTDAFNTPPTCSPSSNSEIFVSGWLGIGRIEKYFFQSDFVTDDAFRIGFSTQSVLG